MRGKVIKRLGNPVALAGKTIGKIPYILQSFRKRFGNIPNHGTDHTVLGNTQKGRTKLSKPGCSFGCALASRLRLGLNAVASRGKLLRCLAPVTEFIRHLV